jgi:serine/threonine protein kinase/tetratricopeptide (TPR) repeat protein
LLDGGIDLGDRLFGRRLLALARGLGRLGNGLERTRRLGPRTFAPTRALLGLALVADPGQLRVDRRRLREPELLTLRRGDVAGEHLTAARAALGHDIDRSPREGATSDVAAERQVRLDADLGEREIERVAGIEIDDELLLPAIADEVGAHRVLVGHVDVQARTQVLRLERLDGALDRVHGRRRPYQTRSSEAARGAEDLISSTRMVEVTSSDAAPPSVEETMAALALETPSLDETLDVDSRAVSVVDDTMVSGTYARPTTRTLSREPKPGSETPTAVGRYIVLGRLGAGAMGEVLAAYDPRLDRKVAVKRIHPGGGSLEAARIRLEREAQALAKLDHRNVVKVHDVIVQYDSVFVAMEFVEGKTLGEWMRGEDGRPRHWREIVPVFEAFGAGLAAVHAVGLVHRDVKPGNVMIGADGRVRVMDFGLARLDDDADEGPEVSAVHEIPEELAELRDSIVNSQIQTQELTQAGAMLGTPAYMAPEQFSGLRATARSDQFSFCITLHEALYGVRPFSGNSMLELCTAVIEGKLDDPPRDVEVPTWLRAVVLRGLAHAASARFASMDELLAALGTGELRRRRRRYAAVGLGLVAAVFAFLGMQRWDLAQREQACVAAGEVVDELWNPQTQAELEAGMLATELSYAATSVERMQPWLDGYSRSWAVQAQAACAAATVEQRWDADTHARASWCLEQRRSALASLIDRLARAEGLDVQYAVQSAAALESPDACTDVRVLDSMGAPPDPVLRPKVLELQDRLALVARIDSSEGLGQGQGEDSPLEIARAIERDARALPWLPLAIRARQVEARLLRLSGELDEAESQAAAAHGEAARAGLWAEASSAAILVGSILAEQPLRTTEARLWLENAEIARTHASDPHGLLRSEIEASLAAVELTGHSFEAALEHGEEARAGLQHVFGSEHPRVGDALHELAEIHSAKADYAKALELETEALELFRRSFGPNHPRVGRSLSSIGEIRVELGEREEAALLYEQAMAIFELDELSRPNLIRTLNLLGMMRFDQGRYQDARAHLTRATELVETTPNVSRRLEADTINNLGLAFRGLNEYAKARELYERALAIFVEILGTDSKEVASLHNNIAILLYLEGDIPGCAKRLELSIEIEERILGPQHPSLVGKIVNLGRTRAALGDFEQALDDVRRALAINELALGRESPENGPLYWRLGIISTQAGDHRAGLAAFERGLVLLEKDEKGWARDLARLRLSYGQALWDAPAEAGRDRVRGRSLVERAREGFAAANDPSEVNACDEWLAGHR